LAPLAHDAVDISYRDKGNVNALLFETGAKLKRKNRLVRSGLGKILVMG
jgi:hypothetical protein